jgi:HK97 gp10 family phage protein
MELDDKPTDPKALRELANSAQVQDVCEQVAKDIQKDARRLAPKRTGNLRRGIVVEEYTDLRTGVDGFAVGWSDRAWYGWMVESGTENEPARPHLVPAAIKHGAVFQGGDL